MNDIKPTVVDDIMLNMAVEMSKLSKCKKQQVACLFTKNGRILSTGVNGTVSDTCNQCETIEYTCSACNEIIIITNQEDMAEYCLCKCGHNHSIDFNKNTKYVTKDNVLHAEENAILNAAKEGISLKGCTLYITLSPCIKCARMIAELGTTCVVYKNKYRNTDGLELLKSKGIAIVKGSTNE